MKSAGEGHHKKVNEKRNIILRMYYATYVLFGYCCVSAEFTYIIVRSSLPAATCVTNNWPVFTIVSVVFVGPGLCDQEYCKCCAALERYVYHC